jgi:DNA modification methylase
MPQLKDLIIKTEKVNWQELKDLQPNNLKTPYHTENLKKSLVKNGFAFSFYVWEDKNGDKYLVDGHLRSDVLIELKNEGFDIPDELSCTFLDLPNRKTAIKYLLEVFNQKTNPINKESLDDWFVLEEIEDIEVEVDWLNVEELEEVEVEELEAQEDDFEEPEPNQIKTDIVKGDIFEFRKDGKTLHRLLCGDSTDSDSVAKLMNGNKADISFTSPPYNTKENAKLSPHQSNGTKYNSYSDDLEDDEYLKLLTDFTNNSLLFSDYSFVNIQSLSGNKTALIDYLYNLKSIYADTLIWNKQNAQPAMANNVLNSQFEYVHCFSHKANRAIGTKEFRGTISNVIDISKQSANKIKEHNATFPVDFANFFVSNFSNNSVLDLFCGSGSTMVAAHQLKRKCYGMELDEKYCQVIVDRMKKLDPELEIVKI